VIQKLGILQEGCTIFFLGGCDHCATPRRKRKKKNGCKVEIFPNNLKNWEFDKQAPQIFILLEKNFSFSNPFPGHSWKEFFQRRIYGNSKITTFYKRLSKAANQQTTKQEH
jgi:hypothetical protein